MSHSYTNDYMITQLTMTTIKTQKLYK